MCRLRYDKLHTAGRYTAREKYGRLYVLLLFICILYLLLMRNKWMMIYTDTAYIVYYSASKALSTLSQKSATVAENGETTATVSLFCDSVDRL